jgi:hypothetical protein
MKTHCIPEGVLARVFKCEDKNELASYVRLETWGEGSCFFHSLCMLLVKENKVRGDQVTYILDTPNSKYQSFTVPIRKNMHFRESFRQVGLELRMRLSNELSKHPKLWAKFERENTINLTKTDKIQTMGGAVDELSKKEVWADIWTIRYCVWRLQVNALFVNPSSDLEPIYCGVENFTKHKRTVFIYWSNHSHFEPIVQVRGNSIVRSFGQNHRFLECLRSQYKKACPLDPIEK